MKRSILLSLFAALALAVGVSSLAIAAGDSTAHAAKKGKKSCKGKKGKGKAGKSSTATAQAKKKGKGCKPKAPPKSDELTDGHYVDAGNGVELNLESSGKLFYASVKFRVPDFCATIDLETKQPTPAKPTGSGLEVSESGTTSIAGVPFSTSFKFSVTESLAYSLTAEVKPQDSSLTSCQYSGTIKGTLAKG